MSPLMPANYVPVVTAEQRRVAGADARSNRSQQCLAAARRGVQALPQRRHGHPRRVWDLLRHGAGGGLLSGNHVPFVINEVPFTNPQPAPTVVLPQVFPTAGGAGPAIGRTAAGDQSGSAVAVQPSVERDDRASSDGTPAFARPTSARRAASCGTSAISTRRSLTIACMSTSRGRSRSIRRSSTSTTARATTTAASRSRPSAG